MKNNIVSKGVIQAIGFWWGDVPTWTYLLGPIERNHGCAIKHFHIISGHYLEVTIVNIEVLHKDKTKGFDKRRIFLNNRVVNFWKVIINRMRLWQLVLLQAFVTFPTYYFSFILE